MENETAAAPDYSVYWKAWGVLLVITLLMVFSEARGLLIAGMIAKASIIAFWFMHLKSERRDFVIYVLSSIVIVGLLLFFLIAPDGAAS